MKILAITISFVLTTTLAAHSGRTNSEGCHAGKQPYHCHSGGTYTDPEKARRLNGTYRPSKSNTRKKSIKRRKSSKSKTRSKQQSSSGRKQSFVVETYNKLIANPRESTDDINNFRNDINNLIETARENPRIVRSCDEWFLVASLLKMAGRVDPNVPMTIEAECYRIGLRKFSTQMKSLMN